MKTVILFTLYIATLLNIMGLQATTTELRRILGKVKESNEYGQNQCLTNYVVCNELWRF